MSQRPVAPLPKKAGYIRKRSGSGAAHAWTGEDTACRMYSTGGLKRHKYEFAISPGDAPICQNCVRELGYDPSGNAKEETVKTDIVGRLQRWTISTDAQPASDLMEEAAGEIVRLRVLLRQKDESLAVAARCENAALEDYRRLSDRWDKAIEELPHLAKGGRLMDELEFLRKVVRRMVAVQELSHQIHKPVIMPRSYAKTGENRVLCDTNGDACTPVSPSTQGEGKRRDGCIVARLRAEVVWEPEVGQLMADAAGEIERLRSRPCPYVTGDTTHYCTLTPLTLTDAEREAIGMARSIMLVEHDLSVGAEFNGKQPRKSSGYWQGMAESLRLLLERTRNGSPDGRETVQ